jgi:DNA-binding transcriptional regulator YdaS (Cro superfamily)
MNLETYLKKFDVTQTEFAKRIDCSPGLVWQIINGEVGLTPERAAKIEKATDGHVTIEEQLPNLAQLFRKRR